MLELQYGGRIVPLSDGSPSGLWRLHFFVALRLILPTGLMRARVLDFSTVGT